MIQPKHLTQASEESGSEVGWRLSHSYTQLPSEFYQSVHPTPVRQPSLAIVNRDVAEGLGLSAELLTHPSQVATLAGNRLPPNACPIAQAYAGHQFGGFTMLGDGRAILLGEQSTPHGSRLDVQLKGSGPTPFSRRGDGRASLGPMLREYIISHAMQALGIPTTLSLAVMKTGETVYRYGPEPGAVLTRIASSHLRVGTFQYAAALTGSDRPIDRTALASQASSPQVPGDCPNLLQALADYSINRHYPELEGLADAYYQFLRRVIQTQATLVAQWMCVGFVHGVMNTDNMSISGETIDYGPCAFMNTYSPRTVFSSIDEQGRYAFGNQPGICQWNLARFAETLLPLLSQHPEEAVEIATSAISEFPVLFSNSWLAGMRRKLGLVDEKDEDRGLIESLLSWMDSYQVDFTVTMRDLTLERWEKAEFQMGEFQNWKSGWDRRRQCSETHLENSRVLMRRSNPTVIPRNHRVEEALSAAVGDNDLQPLVSLLDALSQPFDELESNEEYRHPPPGGDQGYCTYCGT